MTTYSTTFKCGDVTVTLTAPREYAIELTARQLAVLAYERVHRGEDVPRLDLDATEHVPAGGR